jgi:hypothetical protein
VDKIFKKRVKFRKKTFSYLKLSAPTADAVDLEWQPTLLADWLIHQPVLTNGNEELKQRKQISGKARHLVLLKL